MVIKEILPDGSVFTSEDASSLTMGTSGQGEIECSYDKLFHAFGEPTEGDGYKTQVE